MCLFFSRSETQALKDKLDNLQKKIIVGGENLLEKAEEQERLLEASAKELEHRMTREEQLKQELQRKEVYSILYVSVHYLIYDSISFCDVLFHLL